MESESWILVLILPPRDNEYIIVTLDISFFISKIDLVYSLPILMLCGFSTMFIEHDDGCFNVSTWLGHNI